MEDGDERTVRRILLGLGLDKPKDDLLRITRGERFYLIGGSQPTHERMQELCVRFSEEAARRAKTLDDLTPEEYRRIALKLGLVPRPEQ